MTKEQILDFVDNCKDINSPEMKEFKKKVNSDPELKALVEEVKSENYTNSQSIEDLMFDAATLMLSVESKNEQDKFDILSQYLTMPSIIINRITGEQVEKISKMVNEFISTSSLPKDQTDKLLSLLEKLENKSKNDLDK